MYIIKTGERDVELKASAASYRKLKLSLGVRNLKAAFLAAYEDMDIDFLTALFVSFAVEKTTAEQADEIIDECIGSGMKLAVLFEEAASFLNGMGFFGELSLEEGETAIEYFKNPLNRVDLNSKLADAMDNSLNSVVSEMVAENVAGAREQQTDNVTAFPNTSKPKK